MNTLELYEKKIVMDEEFPAQVQTHSYETKSWEFTRHWHEHVELHYVLEGIGRYQVEQQQYEARPGTLIIANGNELHWGGCETVPFLDHTLIFRMDDLSKEMDEENLVFANAIHDDPKIREYMDQIWEEIQQAKPGSKAACKALLLQLLVYLRRNYVVQTLTKEESHRKKREQERIEKVISYIEKHYTEAISNQELADLLFLSKGRFEHLFRECLGVSPLQYINELRLKKAMSLIKGSSFSVTEIAAAVGFSDYNHFGRLFRKYYGCAPRQIPRLSKKAESYE